MNKKYLGLPKLNFIQLLNYKINIKNKTNRKSKIVL